MLDFLFKKHEVDKSEIFNNLYSKIKEIYSKEIISAKRQKELSDEMEKYGYLPYSQAKALEELTSSEVIFCLEKKLELNSTLTNGKLKIANNEISAVKRFGYADADWIKQEQHDIKLINLAALGDGAKDSSPAKFIDWLRQIVILPSGNPKYNILSTTIYLVPFQPRDFGNAYLSASTEEVSERLTDKGLIEKGISAKEQIQTFIALAQLAGHPVIYDVFPQCGRYSKTVMVHPEIARWVDVKFLTEEISKALNFVAIKLSQEFDEDDVTIVRNIYKTTLKSGSVDLAPEFMPIYKRFTEELESKRKELSNFMTKKEEQKKLQKRVTNIVAKIEGVKPSKLKKDKDITKRGEIINALIEEGLWTLPDGAWCSSGIPVFERMAECGSYPMFRHYNQKGDDVSKFAESDCQTPFYFVYLENGDYNLPVINFYLEQLQKLQQDYNFDGFRISHTDFVVDEMSEKDLRPISYRAPRFLLKKINEIMKKETPYFATIAEYRLWNSYFKEYHQDMNFDLLWGNDTKTDYEKIPTEVINNNRELQDYNATVTKNSLLSIIKTYNNQDGEFRTVNRYLGLMDKEEALFKWFKFKFLPGGKLAKRPVMYVDGDESFSKDGIEATIQEEVSLIREHDEDFYHKFDAIRRLAINNELTVDGEAQIINQNKNGFISWMISKETVKECFIIAANYLPSNEKILKQNSEGIMEYSIKTNNAIENKKIEIPGDFVLASEFIYEEDKQDFIEHYNSDNIKTIEIDKLEPSEFRIYKIKR
ncbi:TPA: hypothetical protein IAA87_01690 [Candidatus Avigastranaerophilus faecigallinarum]|nr:hypothetical protein [Candidatus Avigastranaerophilus faecigallinarum]